MGLNSFDSSSEFSQPVQEVLSKTQKAVLDRVVAILEHDPKLNAVLTGKFKQNFLEIVGDIEKFNLLMEKIGATEMQKLWDIQKRFEAGELTGESAKEESKTVITHYTQMQLSALENNIESRKTA